MAIKIGIFFGSDTGNTENVAMLIQKEIGEDAAQVFDISKSSKDDINSFDVLLLGAPTWYYGEMQCDWNDFLPTLADMDLSNKAVGLFGCGDQEDYAEYFCDGMKPIYDVVVARGATLIGSWSIEGYHFEASGALLEQSKFVGLVIDEDRQPEKTDVRIKLWVQQIKEELNLD